MTSSTTTNQDQSPPCLSCGKSPLESVNVHSGLARRHHRSIRDQICDIVGSCRTEEACDASEVVCLQCLKLLLGINNLELELAGLKREFCEVFQLGVESRKCPAGDSIERLRTEIDEQNVCDNDDNDYYAGNGDSNVNRRDDVLFLNTNVNDGNDRTSGENSDDYNEGEDNEINHSDNGIISIAENDDIGNDYRTVEVQITNNITQNTGQNYTSFFSISGKNTSDNEENGTASEPTKESKYEPSKQTENTPIKDIPVQYIADSLKMENDLRTNEQSLANGDQIENFNISSSIIGHNDITESCPDVTVSGNNPKEVAIRGIKRSRRKTTEPQVTESVKRKKSTRKSKSTAKLKKEIEAVYTLDDVPSGDGEIKEDLRQDHNKTYKCKICGEKYISPDKLADHKTRAHSDIYKYVCDKCPNVVYCNKWELTRHCKSQHQVHIHRCPGCGVEEASQQSLDQHIINQHPDSRYFKCKICSKEFRTYRYLHFVHIKRCHIGLPIKYYCDKCNKGFKDKSSLDNHRHTHSEVKNYSCEFCGALFRSPYSLKVHINTHTQEKKYTCQVCGMSFLRLCNLIGHRKYVHSRDNRYVCEVCGKVVHTHKGLVRHQILYHAKGKLFPCDECSQSFTKKESLRTHLLTQHSQERPHKCECGKAYANSSCLRRHLKSTHRIDQGEGFGVEEALMDVGSKAADVDNEEENVVVITVKECAPHMYSVQSASPHGHEVMVSGDAPSTHIVNSSIIEAEPIVNAHAMELPLLHSTFSSITADRIGLSTPILFAALNSNPVTTVHQAKGTIPAAAINDGMSQAQSTFEQTITEESNGLQTTNPFHSTSTSIVSSDEQNSLEILQEDSSNSQNHSPLPSEVLELPAMNHTASNGVPVTYITSWPT